MLSGNSRTRQISLKIGSLYLIESILRSRSPAATRDEDDKKSSKENYLQGSVRPSMLDEEKLRLPWVKQPNSSRIPINRKEL